MSHALLYSYICLLVLVCIYGMHRYSLVYLYYKYRHNRPRLGACFREYPFVTVQLPMYNERFVARRVIERACQMDYPRDRLEIQVLDDSTDDTTQIAQDAVEELQARGHNIVLLHRRERQGFKAGALQEGLQRAAGEFVCIFDADFVPTPTMLREAIHFFSDPQVGMVQVRWEHLNRNQSLLTRTQAVLLDGHFVMEHGARNRSGRFMNFNGTAGIWRKTCIAEAGGWQHDTLTEDLDLSYRAQLRGWKFVFLADTEVPAELPPEMAAFKAQQYRWTRGGAQTCRKLLPQILRSQLPWTVKLEAFWHLTGGLVYGFMVLLTLLLFPALYLKVHVFESTSAKLLFDFTLLMLATFSASSFYVFSQRELKRSWWASVKYLPAVMSLGIGIAINNARAMLHGFLGGQGEFVRTPKYGASDVGTDASQVVRQAYTVQRDSRLQSWIEVAMGLYMSACLLASLRVDSVTFGVPFLFLFAVGYLYVGLSTLLGPWWRRRASRCMATEVVAVS